MQGQLVRGCLLSGHLHQEPDKSHTSASGLQVLVTVMHLTRWHIQDDRTSVLVALQVLLLWLKVQYFARCADCLHAEHS